MWAADSLYASVSQAARSAAASAASNSINSER